MTGQRFFMLVSYNNNLPPTLFETKGYNLQLP